MEQEMLLVHSHSYQAALNAFCECKVLKQIKSLKTQYFLIFAEHLRSAWLKMKVQKILRREKEGNLKDISAASS